MMMRIGDFLFSILLMRVYILGFILDLYKYYSLKHNCIPPLVFAHISTVVNSRYYPGLFKP